MIIYGIAVKLADGEFMYKAKSWPYERRVVCKVEKPENQMVYMYTFAVTNMDSLPEYLIKFYYKRGLMENFIGVLCHFMLQ